MPVATFRPYTHDEKQPFTDDPEAREAIGNIFCKGDVERAEALEDFLGWVVNGVRPLWLTGDGILAYGITATVFDSYAEAVKAAVDTLRYARKNKYEWFNPAERIYPEGKLRIFSVVKPNATHTQSQPTTPNA